jgi:hypothetical protein
MSLARTCYRTYLEDSNQFLRTRYHPDMKGSIKITFFKDFWIYLEDSNQFLRTRYHPDMKGSIKITFSR